MTNPLLARLAKDLADAEAAGTYKRLRPLASATGPRVEVPGRGAMLLMCSNDYLGFANHPRIVAAAETALRRFGVGPASVRFIAGSLTIHQALEARLAEFLHTESAITYSSAWAANTGLFAAITAPGDVVISDGLNHASIIDGCRMVQKGVAREIYPHKDMAALAALLERHKDAPGKVIVTDGVFSMEGDLAPLPQIATLAQAHGALIVLDDSHGIGVLGPTGRGTAEHFGLLDRVTIQTGTLGKSLGGGAGGYVAGPKAVTETLIQRSRPHLFSNGVPAAIAAASLAALDLLTAEPGRVHRLQEKARYFRARLRAAGLKPLEGESAIVPVIVGETAKAIALSNALYDRGLIATGFGFPVVPEGEARIRFQISDAHSTDDLDEAAALIMATFSMT